MPNNILHININGALCDVMISPLILLRYFKKQSAYLSCEIISFIIRIRFSLEQEYMN